MFASTSNFGNMAFDKIKDLILADAGTVGTRLTIDPLRAESDDTTVSSSGTLYLVPDQHAFIPLFDGRRFVPREVPYDFTGAATNAIKRVVSLDVNESGLALAYPNTYDIYAKYDRASGMPVLTAVKWNSATARFSSIPQTPWMHPDGLGFFRGRLVRCMGKDAPGSGDAVLMPEQLYVGTIYTTSITGIGDPRGVYDSSIYRYLWNFYNQRARKLRISSTSSHAYTTGSWRNWNNSTSNRVNWIQGIISEPIHLELMCTNTGGHVYCAISPDSVAPAFEGSLETNAATYTRSSTSLEATSSLGLHYAQVMEYGATSGNFDNYYLNGRVQA